MNTHGIPRSAAAVSRFALLLLLTAAIHPACAPEETAGGAAKGTSKVFLIGIDAGDWYLLDPLIEQGRLPHIKKLIDNGTRSLLMTILPTSSPIIWNSIATGKTMDKHGITNFARMVDGEYQPYTSNLVRARTLWDLLNEEGVKTNVVGWWTTWPAQALDGKMVSSYVSLTQRGWKGSVVTDIPNQTYPVALFDEITPLIKKAKEELPGRIERIFGEVGENELNEATRSNFEDTKWCLLSDEIFHQAALYVQGKYPAPFFAVYLGGIDVLGHRFWKYMEPWASVEYVVTEEERKQFGKCILNYYELVDGFVGDFMALADEDTTFILVSDHGMKAYPPSSNPYIADRSGAHDNAEAGIILLSGKNIEKNRRLKRPPNIYDIAPTILYLMGHPVDEAMDGRVLMNAIVEEFEAGRPVQMKRYADKPQSEEGFIQSEGDAELIERLRALGYLK